MLEASQPCSPPPRL